MQAALQSYDQIEAAINQRFANRPGRTYWPMTMSFGRHVVRAMLTWCDETLATLHTVAEKPDDTQSR